MIKKLTPVLIVDAIEPVLPLWESIGFRRTAEVPHGDRLGFVILQSGGAEVMYQTFDSVRADEPKSLDGRRPIGASGVFVEVEKLDAISVPRDTDVIVQRRKTFYGSTEMIVRDIAGNIVVLAEMEK